MNGGSYDLLQTYTYNSQHLPLTATDAAAQTTVYTYNAAGQVATVTTLPRAGISENRTTTRSYDANGYLQAVTQPATGATTTYGYDGYGRVRTVAGPTVDWKRVSSAANKSSIPSNGARMPLNSDRSVPESR